MKRTAAALVLLLAATVTAEAQKATTARLKSVLERAVTNEREAVIRYEAFAAKAEAEGYAGAAALFRAAAEAEKVHAQRFIDALKGRGLAAPERPTVTPEVGATVDNLRAASSAESSERDGIYREALTDARDARDDELALYFDQTRDTEVEHANLLGAAARQLEKFKEPRTYFVCRHCGYTGDLDLPFCVLCRTQKHPHKVE